MTNKRKEGGYAILAEAVVKQAIDDYELSGKRLSWKIYRHEYVVHRDLYMFINCIDFFEHNCNGWVAEATSKSMLDALDRRFGFDRNEIFEKYRDERD